jgi:FKBP-type peptidyl-prolyl cis-trans isomerase
MMNLKWLAIVALFFAALPAKAQTRTPETPKAPAPAQTLKTEKERTGYVIGCNQAKLLQGAGLDELDVDSFFKGFKDGYSGKDEKDYLITPPEMVEIIKEVNKVLREKAAAKLKAVADKNKEMAAQDMEKLKVAPNVISTGSGLLYKISAEGTGPKPTDEDTVLVNYTGTLIDKTKFDEGQAAEYQIGKIGTPGLKEAFKLMPVGSIWKIFVPPALGYGERAVTGPLGVTIPANSILVFDMELVAIKPR